MAAHCDALASSPQFYHVENQLDDRPTGQPRPTACPGLAAIPANYRLADYRSFIFRTASTHLEYSIASWLRSSSAQTLASRCLTGKRRQLSLATCVNAGNISTCAYLIYIEHLHFGITQSTLLEPLLWRARTTPFRHTAPYDQTAVGLLRLATQLGNRLHFAYCLNRNSCLRAQPLPPPASSPLHSSRFAPLTACFGARCC